MNNKYLYLLLGLLLTVMAATAQAQVARVLETRGTALVEREGQPARFLGSGEALNERDVISVARDSWAIIEFNDQTRVSLRPNTVFRLDAYKADAPESMLLGLTKGGLRVVTGLFGKRNPRGVSIQTATATIGIRGTEFDARLCDADCAAEERAKPAPRPALLPVARVVEMNGVVGAGRAGEQVRLLVPGAMLNEGDAVAVGRGGSALLVFRDGARVALVENSRFAINRFRFSEAQPREGSAFLTLYAGNALVTTGQLAKISPDAFLFRTALGVVRPFGTTFGGGGCIGSLCASGSVTVNQDGASASGSASAGDKSASGTASADKTGVSATTDTSGGGGGTVKVNMNTQPTGIKTPPAEQVFNEVAGAVGNVLVEMGNASNQSEQNAQQQITDAGNKLNNQFQNTVQGATQGAVSQAVNALNTATAPIVSEMTALMAQMRNNPPQTEAAAQQLSTRISQLSQLLNTAITGARNTAGAVAQNDVFRSAVGMLIAQDLTFKSIMGATGYGAGAQGAALGGGLSVIYLTTLDAVRSDPYFAGSLALVGLSDSDLVEARNAGVFGGSGVIQREVASHVAAQGSAATKTFFSEAQATATVLQQRAEQEAARIAAEARVVAERLAAERAAADKLAAEKKQRAAEEAARKLAEAEKAAAAAAEKMARVVEIGIAVAIGAAKTDVERSQRQLEGLREELVRLEKETANVAGEAKNNAEEAARLAAEAKAAADVKLAAARKVAEEKAVAERKIAEEKLARFKASAAAQAAAANAAAAEKLAELKKQADAAAAKILAATVAPIPGGMAALDGLTTVADRLARIRSGDVDSEQEVTALLAELQPQLAAVFGDFLKANLGRVLPAREAPIWPAEETTTVSEETQDDGTVVRYTQTTGPNGRKTVKETRRTDGWVEVQTTTTRDELTFNFVTETYDPNSGFSKSNTARVTLDALTGIPVSFSEREDVSAPSSGTTVTRIREYGPDGVRVFQRGRTVNNDGTIEGGPDIDLRVNQGGASLSFVEKERIEANGDRRQNTVLNGRFSPGSASLSATLTQTNLNDGTVLEDAKIVATAGPSGISVNTVVGLVTASFSSKGGGGVGLRELPSVGERRDNSSTAPTEKSGGSVTVYDGDVEVVGRGWLAKGETLSGSGRPVRLAALAATPVVRIDPDLFKDTERTVEQGLYVWVRDGAVQVAKDDKTVDVTAGNAAVATKDTLRVLDTVPNFLRFDSTPRPFPAVPGSIDIFRAGDGAMLNMCSIR